MTETNNNSSINPANQMGLFPATANDFEYSFRCNKHTSWHPIILENENYICAWLDCLKPHVIPKDHCPDCEIKRNPDYKGNKE